MIDYKYWIALEQAKGIGPVNLNKIYNILNRLNLSIIDLFDLNSNEIKEEFQFNDKIIEAIINSRNNLSMIEEDYCFLLESGVDCIIFFENSYPDRFHSILSSAFPPILYTYGNKRIIKDKGAAILGEKNISKKGEDITYLAAKELADHNIVTISGLAEGADMIAHKSALQNGGESIVILPYGIRRYFEQSKTLEIFADIPDSDKLLIISPFYPIREYNKFNAYIRNRLICALSYAVFIVESSMEGGIYETAKSAQELAIPLFVTEYSKYPDSASFNMKLLENFGAIPIKGRLVNNKLVPNLDRLIGIIKFT